MHKPFIWDKRYCIPNWISLFSEVSNAFQISHANKSFHVFALSSADKANWLANLHKHINKVALSGNNEQVWCVLFNTAITLLTVSDDNQLVTKPVWVPDSVSKECMICSVKFTAFIRKHHCRRCGRVVCSACSPHRIAPTSHNQTNHTLLEAKKLERTCKECFKDMSSKNIRSGGKIGRVYASILGIYIFQFWRTPSSKTSNSCYCCSSSVQCPPVS